MKAIKIPCTTCGKHVTIRVSEKSLEKWLKGAHVQDAMPELPPGEREMFISQTCDKCWKRIFGDTEENPKKNPNGMIEFNRDIMSDAIRMTEHRFSKPIHDFQKEEFDYLWKLYNKASDNRISLKIYPDKSAKDDLDLDREITLPEITRPLEISLSNPPAVVKTKADETKWRRAVRSAERKFKKKEKSFGDRQWRYVMGAYKKMKNI